MKIKQILIIIAIILLNSTLILGAGIGSDKLTYQMEFIPNTNLEFEYQLITTSKQTMDYEFYILNEDEVYDMPKELRVNYSDYVEFQPKILKNIAPGARPKFKAIINLPEDLSPPGEHGVRICVQESLSSTGTVGSRSGACGRIIFNIPYPGKYLIIGLIAQDTDVNNAAKIDLSLNSRGEKDINEVKGAIEIYDENNNLVKTLTVPKTSLKSRERKIINLLLDTIGMKSGEYTAKAVIKWDEGIKTKEDIFRIGAEKVKLLEITKEYQNNTINPVEMKLKNDWNKRTTNINAIIKVSNQELKTPTIELGAWQEGTLKTYWDTTGLEIGEYPAEITLNYANKADIYKETFTITEKIIETPELSKVSIPLSGLMIAIIFIVILLILINLFLVFKLRKKK
jgi:hypothetical protein